MFYTKNKRLVITKSAWREMDQIGISVYKLVNMMEAGERKLESKKAGKWLVQSKYAEKFVLIRYAELADKIVVINIGQTTRKVV